MKELRESTDGNFYEVTDKEIELATKLHEMWEDYFDDIDENAMRLAIYRDECTAALRAQVERLEMMNSTLASNLHRAAMDFLSANGTIPVWWKDSVVTVKNSLIVTGKEV